MPAACSCRPEVQVAADGAAVVEAAAGPLGPHVRRPEARQYSGTPGKIANCPVGVFLGYATSVGHVGLDGALFVPREWLADRARCRRGRHPPRGGPPAKTRPGPGEP